MAQVLLSKRQVSGVVGDVIHNSDGVVWRITRVYNAASGLYDWSQEKHDGVQLAIWGFDSPDDSDHPDYDEFYPFSGAGRHGFNNEHLNMPVGFQWGVESYLNSGELGSGWLQRYYPEHLYDTASNYSSQNVNNHDPGNIRAFFGVLKEVWNDYQCSIIPANAGKSVEIPFALIKELASGSYAPKYGELTMNGLYWDKFRKQYTFFTPSGEPALVNWARSVTSRASARPILEVSQYNWDRSTVTCRPKLVDVTDADFMAFRTDSKGNGYFQITQATVDEQMPSATWTADGISTLANPYDLVVISGTNVYTKPYTVTFTGGSPADILTIEFTEPVSGIAILKYQLYE